MEGGSNDERLVARLRHRGWKDGITEVLIDRIDQERKWKLIDFLRDMELKPFVDSSSTGQNAVVSVDICTAESRQICDRIISYMQSIGVDDVSVSSAPYDDRAPEIESESEEFLTDYTPVGSDESAPDGAEPEDSEIEVLVSHPEEDRESRLRMWQRSKDIIGSIRQENSRPTGGDPTSSNVTNPDQMGPTRTESVAIQSDFPKDHNWWNKNLRRLASLFQRKKPKKYQEVRIVNRCEINDSREILLNKKLHHAKRTLDDLTQTKRSLLSELYANENEETNSLTKLSAIELSNHTDTHTEGIYKNSNRNHHISFEPYKKPRYEENNKHFQIKKFPNSTFWSRSCQDALHCSPKECSYGVPQLTNHPQQFFHVEGMMQNEQSVSANFPFIPQPFYYIMPANPLEQPIPIFLKNFQKRISNDPLNETERKTTTIRNNRNISSKNTKQKRAIRKDSHRLVNSTNNVNKRSLLDKSCNERSKRMNGPRTSELTNLRPLENQSPAQEILNASISSQEIEDLKEIINLNQTLINSKRMPIEQQLASIHEKLDRLANIERQASQVETNSEHTDRTQKWMSKKVDIGVGCTASLDVRTEVSQQVDVFAECDFSNDSLAEPNNNARSLKKNAHISNKVPSKNILKKGKTTEIVKQRYENYPGKSLVSNEHFQTRHSMPIPHWVPTDPHDIPVQNKTPNQNRKRKNTRRKCCPLFEKKNTDLKRQLMKQKVELTEIRMILASVISKIEKMPPSIQTENDLISEETDGIEDIQFSFSRPNFKKSVTFRDPLTD